MFVNTRCATVIAAAITVAVLSVPAVHAQPAAPKLRLVRELVLDGVKEDFSVVNGGHANARGDVALTLRQDYQVRIYDAKGARVATIGRRGGGPGEFQSPQVQGWRADTIWVYDTGLRRISYFSRSGQFLRSTPLETTQREVRVLNERVKARLIDFLPQANTADGRLIGTGTIVRDASGGGPARTRVIASYALNGSALRLAVWEDDPRWHPEIAFVNAFAVAPSGEEVLLVSVSDLTPSGSTVRLTRVNSAGAVVSRSDLPYRGVPYPAAKRAEMLRRGVGVDRNDRISESSVPAVLPPAVSAMLRADGMALLTMQEAVDALKVVMVDAKGVVRGEFALPPKSYLMAATEQYVWLRERNADDITSVVRYRIGPTSK